MSPLTATALVVALALAGCKSSGSGTSEGGVVPPDGSAADGSKNPVATDAAPDTPGDVPVATGGDASGDGAADARTDGAEAGLPVPCGAATCPSDQRCITPCCGGAAPPCHPVPDAGTCLAPAHSCIGVPGGFQGCATDCTPPPPYCQPLGAPLPGGCSLDASGKVRCVCA